MAKKTNGRENLRIDNESLRNDFVLCREVLEKERACNEKLRVALRFYADKRNYHREWEPKIEDDLHGEWHYADSVLDRDLGREAEEALKCR